MSNCEGNEDAGITVVSYDGHRGAERPKAVVKGGERLAVREVEDAWIETGLDASSDVTRGFVVRCVGGQRFELTYSEQQGWEGKPLPKDDKTC